MDDTERLRAQIAGERLRKLQEDRQEILDCLDAAVGDEVAYWVAQLEGVDGQIADIAERRGRITRSRPDSTPSDPPEQGRLL